MKEWPLGRGREGDLGAFGYTRCSGVFVGCRITSKGIHGIGRVVSRALTRAATKGVPHLHCR